MAFVGFTWGGWVTAGKAETMVQTRVSEAVVGALAPVCAERFRHTGGAPANLVELKKVAAWSQGEFVEKGGWAAALGSKQDNSAVTHACAESLAKLTAADLG